jgi:hypothetical protein
MEAELEHAQSVRKIASVTKLLLKGLEDDAFSSESAVWTTATQVYTMLQTLSRTNTTLAVALEPYAMYFSLGARTLKADKKAGLPPKRQRRKKVTTTTAPAAVPPVTPHIP